MTFWQFVFSLQRKVTRFIFRNQELGPRKIKFVLIKQNTISDLINDVFWHLNLLKYILGSLSFSSSSLAKFFQEKVCSLFQINVKIDMRTDESMRIMFGYLTQPCRNQPLHHFLITFVSYPDTSSLASFYFRVIFAKILFEKTEPSLKRFS